MHCSKRQQKMDEVPKAFMVIATHLHFILRQHFVPAQQLERALAQCNSHWSLLCIQKNVTTKV